MNGTLKVTPQEFTNAVNAFQRKAGEVQQMHGDMQSAIQRLNEQWKGDAGAAFAQKFQRLKKSMDKIYNMIMEHATDLKKMAEQYNAAEAKAKSLSDGLPDSKL